MVTYIGRVSVETLVRFKWVVISAGVVLVGLFAWVIYLRYLLAKRSIDNQADLEKVRLQLEYSRGVQPQLEYKVEPDKSPQLVWDEKTDSENGDKNDKDIEKKADNNNISGEKIEIINNGHTAKMAESS